MSAKKRVISCRVGDDEYKDITKVASQLNMKKSDVLKLSLADSLNKYRPINLSNKEKRSMEKNRSKALNLLATLSTTSSDLSRRWLLAGNNLNQIAHRENSKNEEIDFNLISQLKSLNDKLSKNELVKQNRLLIRRLTKIWQLLE